MAETHPGALPEQTHIRSIDERIARGRALRKRCPRKNQARWQAPAGRRDPVDLLIEQGKARPQDLLPLRYARMKASPFAFLRGGAAVMAAARAPTQTTRRTGQAAGDRHCPEF